MSHGPGKYDKEAQELLQRLEADGIVLIITGGKRGPGFEVATTDPRLMQSLPMVLRGAAISIEIDLGEKPLRLNG